MKVRVSRHAAIVLASLSIFLVVPRAKAEHADTREKSNEARMACLTGDVARGVRLLAELFVQTRDSTYIFNQGRCFEQNGQQSQAIDRFREYLRITPKLDDAEQASVNQHIAACQALLDAHASGPPIASAPPLARQPEQTTPRPAVRASVTTDTASTPLTVQNAVAAETPPSQPEPGAGLRTAGVIAASLGGAALITGAVLNLTVNGMASDLEQPGAYSRTDDARRADYATAAWVSYGVGGALVASGALLYYVGWTSARVGDASVSLAPARGGVGIACQGSF